MKNIKRALCILGVVVGIFVFYIILMWYAMIPLHNIKLDKISESLYAVPSSAEIIVLDSKKEIGVLTGNSNHCDYYVGNLLQSQKDEGFIRSHYSRHVKGFDVLQIDKEKVFSDTPLEPPGFSGMLYPNAEFEQQLKDQRSTLDSSQNYYVIYHFKAGESRFGDHRCG